MNFDLQDLLFLNRQYCPCCKSQRREDHRFCSDCMARLEKAERSMVLDEHTTCYYPYFYNNFLRALIHRFKFKGETHLCQPLGELVWDYLKAHHLWEDVDALCYVPMYWRKENQRGYNQVRMIAEYISDKTEIPLLHHIEKTKNTKEQNKIDRRARTTNLDGAFELKADHALSGTRLLLLDDVVTSGYTLREVLKTLGEIPESVFCVTIGGSHRGL